MKFWKLLTIAPFLVANLWAGSPAVQELPLPEVVLPNLDSILKKAAQQSPRMISRAIDLEISENDRISARAVLLPSASASYSYYKSKDKQSLLYDDSTNSSIQTYTLTKTPYALSLSQPLFHWGERRNIARIGEIRKSIAEGQFKDGYRQLTQTLRADYMYLVLLKLSVKRALFYRDFANNQLQEDEQRLLKKVISEADIFSTRIAAERAQIALERAESSLEVSLRSFARMAGMGTSFSVDDVPDRLPAIQHVSGTVDRLVASYLKQSELPNPEAFNLRQQLKIEELNYQNARARLRPKLSAIAGTSQDEQNNYFGSGAKYKNSSVYAGLSISWTIFDGFATSAAVRSSLARRRQMESDYRQLTEKLTQDAQVQVRQVGFAAREMSITDRFLISGEGNLRSKEEEYRRGVRSEAEVSQAKLGLFDAQINAYAARRNYLLALGDFLGLVVEDPALANVSAKQ